MVEPTEAEIAATLRQRADELQGRADRMRRMANDLDGAPAELEPAKPAKARRVSTARRPTRRKDPKADEPRTGKRAAKAEANRQIVAAWRAENPGGKQAACEKATGLSYPTVKKYWD